MRKRISDELGIELYDIYGLTEIYGPGIGINCRKEQGIHYWDDFIYIEIIDPATGLPVPDGGRAAAALPHARPFAHHPRKMQLRKLLSAP